MPWLEVPNITSGAHFAGGNFAGTLTMPWHSACSQKNTDLTFVFKNKIKKKQITDPLVNKTNLTFHSVFLKVKVNIK